MSIDSHTSAPEAAPQQPSPNKKKSRKGLIIGVTGGVAGAAIAAGAIMGINAANHPPRSHPTEATTDPTETTEPTPEAEWSPEVTVEDVEIPAGLSTEEVGELVIERFDDWQNAGTDNERIFNDFLDDTGTTGDFVNAIVAQYDPIYSTALYVDGWQSHDDLVRNHDSNLRLNATTLETNLKTSDPNRDPAPFHRNVAFDAVREIASNGTPGQEGYTRVLEIDYTESNNESQNRAGEDFNPEAKTLGTPQGTFTITLVTVGGVEKMATNSVASR